MPSDFKPTLAKEPDIKLLSDALRGNQSSVTSPPAKCCASCFWLVGWFVGSLARFDRMIEGGGDLLKE